MTSALVTALSLDAFGTDSAARVIANVMVGVGFLGGGMILKDPGHIRGLTTASCKRQKRLRQLTGVARVA